MVVISKFISSVLPLGLLFSAIGTFARPAITPAQIEKRTTEASLQNRWDVIVKQVGKNEMQVLCQAIVPHATATKTSIETAATPLTLTATGFTTEVATNTVTDTSSVFETVTNTIVETAVVTQTAPARRDLSDAMQKLFRTLFADANAWTIAKCLQFNPLTDTLTETSTTFTPFVASTATLLITVSETATTTATVLQTSINTVEATSTSTSTVLVAAPTSRACRDRVPVPVQINIARLPNTELVGFDLPVGIGGSTRRNSEYDCVLACSMLSQCSAYFWRPSLSRCNLKGSGWSQDDFHTDTDAAQEPGSVTGVYRGNCAALRPSLTADVYSRCCDN